MCTRNALTVHMLCSEIVLYDFIIACIVSFLPNSYYCLKYCRATQRCFWLLAFISRLQARNIYLPGRMILPGLLIASDKYFLKNLTFVVGNPLVWLRHHSSQTLYVARVKINNYKAMSFLAYRTEVVVTSKIQDHSSWKMNVSYLRAAEEG